MNNPIVGRVGEMGESLRENEHREREKKTLKLSLNVRGQNKMKFPRCT
jgi:hypothetical protein